MDIASIEIFVKENFQQMTNPKLAQATGMSIDKIKAIKRKFGLRKTMLQDERVKVEAFVQDNYLEMTNKQMAEALNVSLGTITGVVEKFGLNKGIRCSEDFSVLDGEVWMPIHIPNCSKIFVSNKGRVSSEKKFIFKQGTTEDGYKQVLFLNDNGTRLTKKVHRLVAEIFIPNPDNLPQVNHLRGKDCNEAEFLEWTTNSGNQIHAWENGLNTGRTGVFSRYTEETLHTFCQRVKDSESYIKVAKELGINRTVAYNMVNGKSHLTVTSVYW